MSEKKELCDCCNKRPAMPDAVYCAQCIRSGEYMMKTLREGLVIEYIDGSSVTYELNK